MDIKYTIDESGKIIDITDDRLKEFFNTLLDEKTISLTNEITRLTAEVAELRKDAERKAITVSDAFNLLQKHMQDDKDYAWSWHCNIAMNAVDAGANHIEANIRTGDFMRRSFGIDTKIFPEYKRIIDAAIKSEQKEWE